MAPASSETATSARLGVGSGIDWPTPSYSCHGDYHFIVLFNFICRFRYAILHARGHVESISADHVCQDPGFKRTLEHSPLSPCLSSWLTTPNLFLHCFILLILDFLLQARWSSSSIKLRKTLASLPTP